MDGSGNVWVTLRNEDQVRVYAPDGELLDNIMFDYGSSPYGIVMSPSKQIAYVSLYGSGELVRLDVPNRNLCLMNDTANRIRAETASAMADLSKMAVHCWLHVLFQTKIGVRYGE